MNTAKTPKPRLGFILASIHTGSALNLWTSLATEAERSGGPFFIFPGGRLDAKLDSEYLRNGVYSLANAENLDGLISWGSSIGGAVSIEELDNFHRALEPLPYVAIAHKMAGHPCVRFDAYTGMKLLVRHFIEEHGARRIAFLRGPSSHVSAEDRYRAYVDALSEASLLPSPTSPLISDPFPWSEGEAAAVQLYEERRLVPGQDFDALIGASDMMVFSAVQYLQKFGFRVPLDFKCAGFNDSAESRILSSPLSTVHMPYNELGLSSFRMIRALLSDARGEKKKNEIPDCVLPAEVVLRESCGCKKKPGVTIVPPSAPGAPAQAPGERLIYALTELFSLDETGQNAVLQPLVSALLDRDNDLFFNLFERVLVRFFEADRDIGLLYDAIRLVKGFLCLGEDFPADLEISALQAIAQVQNRTLALKRYETEKRYAILNSLKCGLLCARDRVSMISILAHYLPQTGIHTAAVVIYESEGYSRYIGGFSPGSDGSAGETDTSADGALFPSKLLLPAPLKRHYESGVFMVLPLFMENQSLGYVVCSVPFFEGSVFEELRSAISSALKGIFLFEETTAAKQKAEQAERAQTEFFANVGSDLCDPLTDIASRLERIGDGLKEGPVDGESLSDQILFLKALVSSQADRTNRLIDLTLSQINELTFNKRLFRLSEILPPASLPEGFDDGSFPLLSGDPDRIAQAVSLVLDKSGGAVSVAVTADGLLLSFASLQGDGGAQWTGNEMLLAEKIILLQFGSFRAEGSRLAVVLPWPNLAGLPPLKPGAGEARILSLSDGLPLAPFNIPFRTAARDESLSGAAQGGENVLLAWKPDASGIADWVRVYALRHHPALFRAPFLCYSAAFSGESLIRILEGASRRRKLGPVLFIGNPRLRFEKWASEENSVYIASIEEFAATLMDITPSLVVFDRIDMDAVRLVRLHPATVLVPVLMLPERISAEEDIGALCSVPHVILCNRGIASSAEFAERVTSVLAGGEILPPHTGALVKKAILYFNAHAPTQIARWKLADSVNVSEDYLTRIFHKEIGLSLWEYLNRYRIFLASGLLLHTTDSIFEIAQRTGFQDQAYFCRVFKKIYGFPPGKLRTKG